MGTQIKTLELPMFYDLAQTLYPDFYPNLYAVAKGAQEWRKRYDLKPASSDKTNVLVLSIDTQWDFCSSYGSLFVKGRSGTGAMDDQKRQAEFEYRYAHIITKIIRTMDAHRPFQIFFSAAHLTRDGTHPVPHTIITAEEYRQGDYSPNPAIAAQLDVDIEWLRKQFIYYCEELEKTEKYQLYIWPYHCMLGSQGQRLVGLLEASRFFHCIARSADNPLILKADNPLTEQYSAFSPQVNTTWDGKYIPNAEKNMDLIRKIFYADIIIIYGQASSHCVKESIEDLLSVIESIRVHSPERASSIIKKIYILRDCMSAVVVPGVVDFTDDTEKAFQKFQDDGMHVVESTTPIEEWPDIPDLGT